jgi:HD-like signal output (HDOD) protein
MNDKDPQPIPRISKVVGPLQAYIRRPSHGEKEIEKLIST